MPSKKIPVVSALELVLIKDLAVLVLIDRVMVLVLRLNVLSVV